MLPAFLTLQERVRKFNLGTPTARHVGTHELVNDLWRELEKHSENRVALAAERTEAGEASTAVEIRKNTDGSIDEIVAKGADVHIEQMSDDGWCVILDMPDGSQWMFWVGAKNERSHVEFRHTETSQIAAAAAVGERPEAARQPVQRETAS